MLTCHSVTIELTRNLTRKWLVGGLMSYLCYLCSLAHSGVEHMVVFCFVLFVRRVTCSKSDWNDMFEKSVFVFINIRVPCDLYMVSFRYVGRRVTVIAHCIVGEISVYFTNIV
jgi:hypothetical protein